MYLLTALWQLWQMSLWKRRRIWTLWWLQGEKIHIMGHLTSPHIIWSPLIFNRLSGVGPRGQQLQQGTQNVHFPGHTSSDWGDLRPFQARVQMYFRLLTVRFCSRTMPENPRHKPNNLADETQPAWLIDVDNKPTETPALNTLGKCRLLDTGGNNKEMTWN